MFSEVKLRKLHHKNYEGNINLYQYVDRKSTLEELNVRLLLLCLFVVVFLYVTLFQLCASKSFACLQIGDVFMWKTSSLVRKVRRGSQMKQTIERLYHGSDVH